MAHVFRISGADASFIELEAKLDGGGVAGGGIRPGVRPGTGPMLLVGPVPAPPIESGPIIAGRAVILATISSTQLASERPEPTSSSNW